MRVRFKTLFLILFLSLFSTVSLAIVPIKEVKILGISPIKATLDSVRKHLWDIGGFLQSRSSLPQSNIDKFFTWSQIRDSYYVTFRYDHAGRVTSIERLYRPESILESNKRTDIQTQDVAKKIMAKIGPPTQIIRKSWGGMPSYLSYIWKDDEMTVIIDRQGSDPLGNIFVKYIVNKVDPYYVEPKPKKVKTAAR